MTDSVSYMLNSAATQMLGSMSSILSKAADHAKTVEVEEGVFLNARLYPDMLTMKRQVQMMCDMVARGGARLAGAEIPSFPDVEETFAELIARLEATLAYVKGLDAAAMDANENVVLQIPMGPQKLPMEGRRYLSGFVLPNLHFHAATAYGLLRHQGVALSKRDFLVPG